MVGGARRSAPSTPKKEAQAALTELLAAHQTGTYVEPSKTPQREFVVGWLDGWRTRAARSYRRRGRPMPVPGRADYSSISRTPDPVTANIQAPFGRSSASVLIRTQ